MSVLLLTTLPLAAALQPNLSGADVIEKAVQGGCSFLTKLYNSTLGLVRETPASNSYHISSDNLLSQEALSYCNQPFAQSVRTSLKPYKNGTDMMHEALLHLPIQIPIHNATIYRLFDGMTGPYWQNTRGNYTIDWEIHNSTGILSDTDYADVASYAALESNREVNVSGEMHELAILSKDYDGKGMEDAVFSSGSYSERGIYQTYKTALYLSVLNALNQPMLTSLAPSILQAQGADGGFHTGYNYAGNVAWTLENAETTSIVVIALESFPPDLRVTTSLWDSGYLGGSFSLYLTLGNNGTKWLKNTNIIVTLDYGTFSEPTRNILVSPGTILESFYVIPIPNTITAGNHSLTITTNSQFYDNVSSIWRANAPVRVMATLIVRPLPRIEIPLLPLTAAVITASFGLISAAVPVKRGTRLSEVFHGKPRGVGLNMALLLIGFTLYLGQSQFHYGYFSLLSVPLAVLATGVSGMVYFVKRVKRAMLLPIALLSLSATLASSVITTGHGLNSCFWVAGFPLPWEIQANPYPGGPPLLCPYPILQLFAPIFFLFDTAFYVTLGIGMVETYRMVRGTLIRRTMSLKDLKA